MSKLIERIKSSHRLFDGRADLFVGLFPLVLMPLIALEIGLGLSFDARANFWITVITHIFFLNEAHVIFPAVMVGSVPELKKWARDFKQETKFNFWLWSILIYLTVVGVSFSIFYTAFYSPTSRWLWIVFFVLRAHHSISQTRGLLLAYDHSQERPSEPEKKRLAQVQNIEGYLFLAMTLFALVVRFFVPSFSSFSKNVIDTWMPSVVVVGLVIVMALVYNSWRSPHSPMRKMFILRLFLLPFVPLSRFAGAIIDANHGIEYFCVTKKMLNNSSAQRRMVVGRLVIASGLLCLVWVMGQYYHVIEQVTMKMAESSPFLRIGFCLLVSNIMAFSIVHYAMDRMIFRMRNKASKNHVASLLNPVKNTSMAS